MLASLHRRSTHDSCNLEGVMGKGALARYLDGIPMLTTESASQTTIAFLSAFAWLGLLRTKRILAG
jgi:hypothetical protein